MVQVVPLPARQRIPILRDTFGVAMAAFAMVGVIVIAGLWALFPPSHVGIATELRTTATTIETHATAMSDDGGRALAAANASAAEDRAFWMSEAKHMLADADMLRALAARLRRTAAALGEQPQGNVNASAAVLRAHADALRADGTAAIEHGRVMIQHTQLLVDVAARPGSAVGLADVTLLAADATRIVTAGQAVLGVAGSLDVLADQLRSMLRP